MILKLALLLPGYVESPDYRHLVVIDSLLTTMGYTVIRVDACHLWQTGDGQNYTTTNYINQVKKIVESYLTRKPTEIVLVGHSLGSLVALQVGNAYQQIVKIICLSPPVHLDKSDHKWVNGFRISKKDLPDRPSEFREFTIPYSFVEDRKQYSMSGSLKNNKKSLLIIMGEDDPSIVEFQSLVDDLNLSNFIKIKNMDHDFRQSDKLCNQVALEIKNFLSQISKINNHQN